MRKTNKDLEISWFGGVEVLASYDMVCGQFGEPSVVGSADNKVQYKWVLETDDGHVVTLYDWKEYDIDQYSKIWWHVGVGEDIDKTALKKEFEKHFKMVLIYHEH